MGTCGSVHHHKSSSSSPQSTPAAAMKLGDSFKSNLVLPPSPIKPKFFTTTFKSFGSQDENFFDSRTYLESDCEDDFYSVNGDFTPSRGNTPVHHSFSVSKGSILDKTSLTTPEPSPRKRLSELFRESENPDTDLQNTAGTNSEVKQTIQNILPKSPEGTPYVSGPNSLCSSERTANGDDTFKSEKSHWSMQGCLPNMVSCRGFSPRKKKMTPVVPTVAKV